MTSNCLDLHELCVPPEACLCAPIGPVEERLLASMRELSYDQSPVTEQDRSIPLGLVSLKHLERLHREGRILEPNDRAISSARLRLRVSSSEVSVEELLRGFRRTRALLVFQLNLTFDSGSGPREFWVGLLTIADLNRQQVRLPLYVLMSELEIGLGRMIERVYREPWDWIRRLNEESQVRALGYWQLAKRRRVDVSPLEVMTLSQLLRIVAVSKELLRWLGYRSRSEFDDQVGGVPELRNLVMHPVRPLVLSTQEVDDLLTRIRVLRDLQTRISTALDRHDSG